MQIHPYKWIWKKIIITFTLLMVTIPLSKATIETLHSADKLCTKYMSNKIIEVACNQNSLTHFQLKNIKSSHLIHGWPIQTRHSCDHKSHTTDQKYGRYTIDESRTHPIRPIKRPKLARCCCRKSVLVQVFRPNRFGHSVVGFKLL